MTDTNAPNSPCHVPVPDGVSECRLSELPSSTHSDDETEHDAPFVQTCLEEVKNAEPLNYWPSSPLRGGCLSGRSCHLAWPTHPLYSKG